MSPSKLAYGSLPNKEPPPLPSPHLQFTAVSGPGNQTPIPFLLLLNGFPGVGKYTLAKRLSTNLKQTHPSLSTRLIDNHLLIDPASAIYPTRNGMHYQIRSQFRSIAFSALKLLPEHLILLMTACLSETEDNIAQFEEYVDIAKERGCVMVVLNVICGVEENKRRLGSEERVGSGKGKLTDGRVLERIRTDYRLLDLERVERLEGDKGEGRVELYCGEVETEQLSVEEAVERVWGLLREWVGG